MKNISLNIGDVEKIIPITITDIAQKVIVNPVFIALYILLNKGESVLFSTLVVSKISVSTE